MNRVVVFFVLLALAGFHLVTPNGSGYGEDGGLGGTQKPFGFCFFHPLLCKLNIKH